MLSVAKYPFAITHSGGCGQVAFYMNHKPEAGDQLLSADAVWPDGSQIERGALAVCGTCGELLSRPRVDDVVPR
jgi:hypothetical protein